MLDQAAVNAERLRTKAGLDAIENDDAARLQRLLVEELHHRAKNTLAIVMAITSQSLKNSTSVEEGRIALEARLFALGRAQDLLLKAHWSSVHVHEVIGAAIAPFDDLKNPKFAIEAGDFELAGDAILPLTLSLNELCTNAGKYGALSMASGRIAITANTDRGKQRFKLTWIETGGPFVHEPMRHSFGSRLIRSLAAQLHGDASLRFEPEGVIYELDAPLASQKAG